MATYVTNPFADWKCPTRDLRVDTTGLGDERWSQLVGMQAYLAPLTNTLTSGDAQSIYNRYLGLMEEFNAGDATVIGRHFTLWDHTNSDIDSSRRRLLGASNVDLPDFAVMNDTIFSTDGTGRQLAGTAPFTFVLSDDGGVFTDESVDAADNGLGDVQLTPSAALAASDAFYAGVGGGTFSGLYMLLHQILVIGSGGTDPTLVLEYSQGAASWNTLAFSVSPANPLSPAATAYGLVGQYILSWTPPGDWASDTVDGNAAFWVRIRISAGASGSGYTSATASKVLAIENTVGATLGRLPVAYELTNNPELNTPAVKAWGIHRLESGATAQVTAVVANGGAIIVGNADVHYTWYDSARDIESEPVRLGNVNFSDSSNDRLTVTVGAHPSVFVDKVRIYLTGTGQQEALSVAPTGATSTSLGFGTKRLIAELAVNSGATNIDAIALDQSDDYDAIKLGNVGDGPYVASSVAGPDAKPAGTHGTFISCDVHGNRIWCGGSYVEGFEQRIVFSNFNNGWTFPAINFVDIPAAKGDRFVGVRSVGVALIVYMRRSVWAITGDPDKGDLNVDKIADIGCVSKRGCVRAGQRVFWVGPGAVYMIDTGLAIQEMSEDIVDLVRGLTVAAMPNIVGAYDGTREVIAWAMPGMQAQFSAGGAGPGQTLNDGMLTINLRTGEFTTWGGTGCYAQSMTTFPTGDTTDEIITGSYWGRVHRFSYSDTQETQSGAITNGVASGGTTSTLVASSGTVLDSISDRRQLAEFLIKHNATNGFEARLITKGTTSPDTFIANPNWTNAPVNLDTWFVGATYVAVETGDWYLNEPGEKAKIDNIQLHLEDAMPSGNAIDLAVDNDDVADTTNALRFSASTVGTTNPNQKLASNAKGGLTQRVRIASLSNGARWVLRALTFWWSSKGKPF